MKFLVLAACMAVSSASLVTYPNGAVVPADEPAVAAARAAHLANHGVVYANYYGLPAAHVYAYGGLVAHPNGAVVPVDEPTVAAAKAEHFAAHGLPYANAYAYAAGYPYAYAPAVAYSGLTVHPNGAVVPVEPADVQAARADHLAAHASA